MQPTWVLRHLPREGRGVGGPRRLQQHAGGARLHARHLLQRVAELAHQRAAEAAVQDLLRGG